MDSAADNHSIGARLAVVRGLVDEAARSAGRDPASVSMLLATKTVEPGRIIQALIAGYSLIGENRVQELLSKADALAGHPHRNHFIGHLQSNKAGSVLGRIDCLQTLDSLRLATRLQRLLTERDDRLDVMVQVNVSGERSKFGIAPPQVPDFLSELAQLDRLSVRGYMTIGLNSDDSAAVRSGYAQLRRVRDAVADADLPGARLAMDLSMGMSGDFADAIAEGATIVRLGSLIFGSRSAGHLPKPSVGPVADSGHTPPPAQGSGPVA